MSAVAAPSPPYVGPPNRHGGTSNKPIHRIVMHCTVGAEPGLLGAARAIGRYFRTTERAASAHYAADSRESVQCAWDSVVCYHAPPNTHSIGYELCCSLSNQGEGHWTRPDHVAMLEIAARDVAQLCLAYDIPIRKVTATQLRGGAHGICGHKDVTDAWHETTHWDPGPHFPWSRFIGMVHRAADVLLTPSTPPVADLHVKSYNLGDANDSVVLAELLDFARDADVIALQEAGDRGGVLTVFLKRRAGWTINQGSVPGSRSVPLLYRKTLDGQPFSRLAVAAMVVGPGAGPDTTKPKAITGLRVGNLAILNTHMVASAWQEDASAFRKGHYRLQMKALARMASRRLSRGQAVLAVGDFNAAPDHELLAPLRALRLKQLVEKPTHGVGIFDHAWTNLDGTADTEDGSSDHQAVSVTIRR